MSFASPTRSRPSTVTNDAAKPLHPENKKVYVGGRTSSAVATLRAQLEAALARIKEQDDQIEQLSRMVEHLEKDVVKYKDQLFEAEQLVVEKHAVSPVPESKIDHVLVGDALEQIEEKLELKSRALQAALHEVDDLNTMIEHLKNLHEQQRQDNVGLKRDLAEQTEELELTQSQLMDMSSKFDGHKDSLNANETGLRQEVARLNTLVQNLQAEINEKDRQSQEMLHAKDLDQQYRRNEDGEKAALREQLASRERELLSSLESTVQKQDSEISDLKSQLRDAHAEKINDERGRQNENAEQLRAQETRLFEMQERQTATLLAAEEGFKAQLDARNERVANLEDKISDLEKKITQLEAGHRQEVESLQAELAATRQDHTNAESLREQHRTEMDELEKQMQHDHEVSSQAINHELDTLREQLDQVTKDRSQRQARTEELESELVNAEIEVSELKAMNQSLLEEINRRRAWKQDKELKKHDANKRPFYPPSFTADTPKLTDVPKAASPVKQLTFSAPPKTYAEYIPESNRTGHRKKTTRKPKFEPKDPPPVPAPGKNKRYSHVHAKTDSTSAYESVAAVNAAALGELGDGGDVAPIEGEGVRKLSE